MKPLLFALLALSVVPLPRAMSQPEGTRILPADLPLKAQLRLNYECFGMPALQVGTDIYVVGGYIRTGVTGSIQRIDTKTNAVETLATKVVPRGFHTAEVVGNSIYIMCGLAKEGGPAELTETVECFDTRTQKVKQVAPIPVAMRNASSAVVGDKIYVVGGNLATDERTNSLWIYDTVQDQWTEGTPMRVARECDVVADEGTLYAIGGFDGQSAVTTCEAHDIATDTWKDLPDLPIKTSAHHLAISNGSIWAFGDYAALNRVQRYDLKAGTWQLLTGTGYDARRHTAVCMVGDLIYVIGGNVAPSGSYLDEVQVFDSTKLK